MKKMMLVVVMFAFGLMAACSSPQAKADQVLNALVKHSQEHSQNPKYQLNRDDVNFTVYEENGMYYIRSSRLFEGQKSWTFSEVDGQTLQVIEKPGFRGIQDKLKIDEFELNRVKPIYVEKNVELDFE